MKPVIGNWDELAPDPNHDRSENLHELCMLDAVVFWFLGERVERGVWHDSGGR